MFISDEIACCSEIINQNNCCEEGLNNQGVKKPAMIAVRSLFCNFNSYLLIVTDSIIRPQLLHSY